MMFDEIQKMVLENIDLIEVSGNSLTESRSRSARFLTVQAVLGGHLKELEDIKAKASTEEKAKYAQALMSQSGKNITENKIMAEADPVYAESREITELIDSEINWTKKHFDIFGNAHILFRQFAQEK